MRRLLIVLLACALALSGCSAGAPEAAGASTQGAASAPASSGEAAAGQVQGEPADRATFSLAVYPAYGFHPALSRSAANLALAPLMYEGLFTLDSQFQPQLRLCQSYTVSPDGLTWTFVLQPGVTFSDGTPLTGDVAAQALNAARGEGSRYQSRLAGVASVQGEGSQVTVTLSQANGALPALLDVPIALGTGERPLGTGPYVLTDSGGQLSLTARSDWRMGADSLPVQSIALTSLGRAEELMPAFNAGEITLMDVDLTGTQALGSSGQYQVWDYPTTLMVYLGFNAQRGLCRDPSVRQAIARAVDRETVADAVFARHAVPAALPIHPDSPWYDQELAGELSYDPAVLSGLGLEGRPITLVVNIENTAKSAAANHVAQQLESAGLVVTVERLPWAEYLETVAAGDFDLYMGEVYLTPDFDLTPLIGLGGGLNFGGWTSSVAGGLLSAFRSAQADSRAAAASALCRHLCQQVPIAPICFRSGTMLAQYGRVENAAPVYGNLFAGLENWEIS